jgi:hypothetical protein
LSSSLTVHIHKKLPILAPKGNCDSYLFHSPVNDGDYPVFCRSSYTLE